MQYGLINLAIVPLRGAPEHKAQQVSQLLFGEIFFVTEEQGQWLKIEAENDGYTGWVSSLQCVLLPEPAYNALKEKEVQLTHEPFTIIRNNSTNTIMYLPAGSCLTGVVDDKFTIGKVVYELMHNIGHKKTSLVKYAHTFINAPYLWGGRTHFGIDCSGFSQAVYRQQGIQLKRDAWQQAEQGEVVAFLQSALPGDLAFFDNEEGRIVHVGIMVSNEQIIHASGSVKVDRIDNQGIYSAEQKKYTHRLRIIKRFF